MGIQFLDQYTYLHFATGIIAYFWNISFIAWVILHTLFELLENTKMGMQIINRSGFWPGGKTYADSVINSVGDTIGALTGWFSAYYLDKMGAKYGWYKMHI